MKKSRLNFVCVFTVLLSLLVISAQPALCFGLKSKVQDEMDQNPFLQKEKIKIRVTDEKNGYLTVEMYEGDANLRKCISKEKIADTTNIAVCRAYAIGDKDTASSIQALQLSMEVLKKIDGVKSIMLTASVNTPNEQSKILTDDAFRLIANNNHEGAMRKLDEAIDIDNKNEIAYKLRSGENEFIKNYKQAINDIDKAISINPSKSFYFILKSKYCQLNSDYKNAIISASEAIKLNKEYSYAFCVRGFSYFKSGDIQQAINDYKKCEEPSVKDGKNTPFTKDVLAGFAMIHVHENDYNKACEEINKAIVSANNADDKKRLMVMISSETAFDKIRNEPCFKNLIKSH